MGVYVGGAFVYMEGFLYGGGLGVDQVNPSLWPQLLP